MRTRLVGIQGALAGESFELGEETTLGRSAECTIMIDDTAVSRQHARIRCSLGGTFIEDLGSGNGTLVNGQSIAAPMLLRDRDIVEICAHVFRVVGNADEAAAAAPTMIEGENLMAAVRDAAPTAMPTIEGTLDMGATIVGGVFQPSAAGDLAKANHRLQSIIGISSAIQTELDLSALLGLVMDNLFEVFVLADRGFLMLYGEDGELRPAASRSRQGRAEQVTISRSIIDDVTERRVAVLSSDAATDERFAGAMSIANYNIRSMMCAPLIAKNDLLGVIHVDTVRPGRKFVSEDLELLCGVAAQTALAIASARMHERLLVQDRTERDLKLATQVQRSFLPAGAPKVEGMEFAAFYRAALEIGGDLYDFIPQGDDAMMVVIGDVSGKGIPAALLMARMSSDVRFFAARDAEPKDVLPRLCRRIEETGMTDGFVTMALARLDLKNHQMLVANAGHGWPLVRRAAEGDVIEAEGELGFPLGIMPDFEYGQSAYALQPGDVVCLVTDGVTEAMDADKNLYGKDRLLRAMAAAPRSARGVLDAILEDVKKHVGDTAQSDDLTCVCFGLQAEGD